MNDTPRNISPERKRAFETAARHEKKTISDREIVREMLGAIRRKRDDGWSYEAIRQELAEKLDFKGTRRTLYNYVWHFTKNTPSRTTDGRPQSAEVSTPSPDDTVPKRRTVRETLCGLPPELPAVDRKRPRESLVDKLNRPV